MIIPYCCTATVSGRHRDRNQFMKPDTILTDTTDKTTPFMAETRTTQVQQLW
jgi:hypothetical protein